MRDLLSSADWKARVAEGLPPEVAGEIPLDLFGLITGLPAETAQIPWDGPQVRIIEHPAHAQGHAALLIEERGVLVAGDMLSDILIPFPDLDAANPIEDYLVGLRLLEDVADGVDVLIPGHGSVAKLIRYAHGSNRIERTCMACVTAVIPKTRASAHRPRSARIGCRACMNGNYSSSPRRERATGRPASDPLGERRRLSGNVGQPDHVLVDRIMGDEAERRPGSGEIWIAVPKHDGMQVDSIFIDQAKVGQGSRQDRARQLQSPQSSSAFSWRIAGSRSSSTSSHWGRPTSTSARQPISAGSAKPRRTHVRLRPIQADHHPSNS